MKREKFLWPLTQSHHRALLAARRVRDWLSVDTIEAEPARVKAVTVDLQKLFDEELRLHFWDEERMLALYEERMGRFEPEPARIRREHRLPESWMTQATRESLLQFAELLALHIHFEEDVLFGQIEKVLNDMDKLSIGGILSAAVPSLSTTHEFASSSKKP